MSPLPALGLAALFGLFGSSSDAKPRLTGLQVALQGRGIEVTTELVQAFEESLVERIETGLPSGYDFRFKLVRDHKRWFDREVASTGVEIRATYDAVSREYLVLTRQDGKLVGSRVVRERAELEAALTRIEGLGLFMVSDEQVGQRLMVKARVLLGSRNILGLIPSTVSTDWVESRKFRIGG